MSMNLEELRRQKVQSLLAKGKTGLEAIAQSLNQPLRFYQDYVSVGRAAFKVETLADGQDPLIDTDVDGNLAYQVADLGRDIQKIIAPETMRVNISDIASNPIITYQQLKSRKYDLQARVKKKATDEVLRVEDRCIFNALSAAAFHEYNDIVYQRNEKDTGETKLGTGETITLEGDPINAPIVTTADTVSIKEISAAMSQIERHGLTPTSLFMNPSDAAIIRNINVNDTNGYYVDFNTSSEIMKNGFMGTVYGLKIYRSVEIPKGRAIVTADPEYVGRVVVSIPLSVKSYELPQDRAIGFSIFESVGILCHNPKAVCGISITE